MDDRKQITAAVERLVKRQAAKFGMLREAVADIGFLYLQRNYRNPTDTQRNAAYASWKGVCQHPECKEKGREVAREDAVFHHLKRRVPEQHGPESLLPYHPECHDKAHALKPDTLSKGSTRRRKPATPPIDPQP